MNQIVVINGSGGVGKSTFIRLCGDISTRPVVELSTIDFPKKVAAYCGWKGTKTEKDRKFLSDLKDALIAWDDIPFRMVHEEVAQFQDHLIFINCREPWEVERLKRSLNASTLLIVRPAVATITSNHADANVAMYDYDYVLQNKGNLGDLTEKATNFLKWLGGKNEACSYTN